MPNETHPSASGWTGFAGLPIGQNLDFAFGKPGAARYHLADASQDHVPPPAPARRTALLSGLESPRRRVDGGRAGTMSEREWKRSYITGLDPESVAKLADTYRRNTVAADRKRKR